MPFAIFYNRVDMAAIAAQLSRFDYPNDLQSRVAHAWDNGMRRWDTAARAPTDRLDGDNDTRLVVMSGNNMNKADFQQLLRDVAAAFPGDPQAQYMLAIADDLENTAVEPWNGGD